MVSFTAQSLDAVYARRDEDRLVYGRSVEELVNSASGPLNVDWRAWASQFYFGYPLGTRTHFNEISMLRPGETQLSTDGSHLSSAVAAFDEGLRTERLSDFSSAVAGVAERLLSAVSRGLARAAGKTPICFLSGGWDSRAIVACLTRLVPGAAFDTFTTSYDGGNDREEVFAGEVAARLGLRHRVSALDAGYYVRHADAALLAADFATDMHVWMSDLLGKVARERPLVNFDGYAGDLLLRGLLQRPDDDARAVNDGAFFDRFAQLTPKTVLTGPIAGTFERLARDELARELAQYRGERRTLRFLLNNRGWRGVAHAVRLQQRSMAVELPFLDPQLIAYVLGIDDSIRLSPEFYPAILRSLDRRLWGVPSTNDQPLPPGWRVCPIEKYRDETVDWFLQNIRDRADSPTESGGVIDWFSVEPARQSNRVTEDATRHRRLRALEMLNLYSLWLKRYEGRLRASNALEYARQECSEYGPSVSPPTTTREADLSSIARKYLERAKALASVPLRFHLTMDVEAFPVSDAHAYHTAAQDLIQALIYGNFGSGSEVERLLLRQGIPCTYFLEAYSPAWSTPSELANAARFFKRDFTELGLHCHAFSLPFELRRELHLSAGWFLEPRALGTLLRAGRMRLEDAVGEPVVTYRSGRLDVYPDMELAIAAGGFRIDSSLVEGRDAYYYAERSNLVGNVMHRRDGIVEVPITSYLSSGRTRILDFNASSFEEMCFVVVRALELGLRSVTLLMHSWSLSEVRELPLLAKGFHDRSSPALHDKLLRLLDFLHELPGVELSTLRNTVASTTKIDSLTGLSSESFDFDPPPLQVTAWRDGDWVVGRCELNGQPFAGKAEYAFYLLIDGERVDTHWYQPEPETRFLLAMGSPASVIVIIGFSREHASPGEPLMKSVRLA